MTLSQLSLITALMKEIQQQAGGDCMMHQTGFNALVQAADLIIAHQDAFEPFVDSRTVVDTETLPLPLDVAIPGWEAA
jgi:hypothetical protein